MKLLKSTLNAGDSEHRTELVHCTYHIAAVCSAQLPEQMVEEKTDMSVQEKHKCK